MLPSATSLFRISREAATLNKSITISPADRVVGVVKTVSTASNFCVLQDSETTVQTQPAQLGCFLVQENEHLVGIVTERDLLTLWASGCNLAETSISDVMSAPVVTLKDTELQDPLIPVTLLHQHRISHLPITNHQGHCLGVLTIEHLPLREGAIPQLQHLTAHDVMVPVTACAPLTATLEELSQVLTAYQVNSVVIVDKMGPRMQPKGTITTQDLLLSLALDLNLATIQAQRVMNSSVLTVGTNTSLWAVHQLLQQEQSQLVVVLDGQGNLAGIITPTTLLTALGQQAALALPESQSLIQQIADSSPTILYLYDLEEQRCLYMNYAVTLILGYTPEMIQEIGHQRAAQLIHPHDQRFVFSTYYERIKTADDRAVVTTEYRVKHSNGKWHWLCSRDMVFSRTADGQVQQVVGTAQDITERKLAEAKLQKQTDRELLTKIISQHIRESLNLQHILNTVVAEVHHTLHADRVLVYQLLPDGQGKVIAESVSPDWPNLLDRIFPEETFPRENYDRYMNGRTFALANREALGVFPCLVTFLRDIQVRAKLVVPIVHSDRLWGLLITHQCSDSRQWQSWEIDLLQQLSSQLAIAIQQAELYTQLQQSHHQVAHANAELLRATQLKDEFLANMSHELRTPLNAILGISEGLQEELSGPLNEQQKKLLGTIERSGQHLLALINDILEVSKIEAGRLQLDISTVSVSELCKSSLAFVKQQAFKKQIQLHTNVKDNMGKIAVDERRIRQVLINLLSNAVKFTPANGQVSLEVHYELYEVNLADRVPVVRPHPLPKSSARIWHQQDSYCLTISVIDTGIGISAANQAKLFQPFVQIDSSLNRQYEGTGLGLVLVKRIVELHGGDVIVTSKLGEGSCFTIRLPPSCQLSTESDRPLHHHEHPAFPGESLLPNSDFSVSSHSPLLLLAEDNEANVTTLSSYLRAKGYRIVLARNGQEAIDLAKSRQPHLILMDIQMPGVDGMEAIQRLRHDPEMQQVPIIALTALAMTGDRERCLEAGATDYLAKPVPLKQLNHLIEQLLRQDTPTKSH